MHIARYLTERTASDLPRTASEPSESVPDQWASSAASILICRLPWVALPLAGSRRRFCSALHGRRVDSKHTFHAGPGLALLNSCQPRKAFTWIQES